MRGTWSELLPQCPDVEAHPLSGVLRHRGVGVKGIRRTCNKAFNQVSTSFLRIYECIYQSLQNVVIFKWPFHLHHVDCLLIGEVLSFCTTTQKLSSRPCYPALYWKPTSDTSDESIPQVVLFIKPLRFMTDCQSRWEEWRKDYGSIIGLKLGSQNAVVLNSYKAVAE